MDANYREPVSGAQPVSFSILSLPPKSEMRKKGYDTQNIFFNGTMAHPLATWKSYRLLPGASYKDALLRLQEVNKKPWGLIRARLHFSDGQVEMFERRDPSAPSSFCNVRTYDPNGVFRQVTGEGVAKSRKELQPLLEFVSDGWGHSLKPYPHPRTFAPEELFKSCPPPVHSQCGYDFTPVSHSSFMLKPADPPKGFRNTMSGFQHRPCDYRPQAFLRPRPPATRHCHCGEVFQVGDYTLDLACQADVIDHRNRRVEKKFNSLRLLQPNSLIVGKRNARTPRFPCRNKTATGAAAGDNQEGEPHHPLCPLHDPSEENQQQNAQNSRRPLSHPNGASGARGAPVLVDDHHVMCPMYSGSGAAEEQKSSEPHHPLCPLHGTRAGNQQQNAQNSRRPLSHQNGAQEKGEKTTEHHHLLCPLSIPSGVAGGKPSTNPHDPDSALGDEDGILTYPSVCKSTKPVTNLTYVK